jgi:hypothetical protein
MIILPRRSRRNRGPRQRFAGIAAVVAALVMAGMPALTRTFRGYPRGSFPGGRNLLPWAVLVPVVVLIAVAVLRFARRNDDDPRDNADAPGDTGDGQPDCDWSPKMLVIVLTVALAALVFGAVYYLSATRPG